MHIKKPFIAIALLVLILGLAWGGASYYAGNQAKNNIAALIEQSASESAIRFSDWRHEQGPFYSFGEFVLHYPDPDAVTQPRPDLFALLVRYDIDHRVLPHRVFAYDWSAEPVGKSEQAMTALFGVKPVVIGQGTMNWQGRASSVYQFPELAAKDNGDELAMSAMTGEVVVQGAQMDFNLSLPTLQIVSNGERIDVRDIAMTMALQDRFKGLGGSVFTVAKADFPRGAIRGFRLEGNNVRQGDRLTFRLDASVDQLQANQESIDHAVINLVLEGLNAQSVSALSEIMDQAGNFENLTPEQEQLVQNAIKQLVISGFSVSMPEISAQSRGALAKGSASLEIKPPAAGQRMPFDAASQIVSGGQIDLTGKVPPELAGMGMMFGVLVKSTDGFRSSYAFKNGALTVNGRPVPVARQLAEINAGMAALLK